MSEKGQRNQNQQPSKLEKGYGGYLPSVQSDGHQKEGRDNARVPGEQNLRTPR